MRGSRGRGPPLVGRTPARSLICRGRYAASQDSGFAQARLPRDLLEPYRAWQQSDDRRLPN